MEKKIYNTMVMISAVVLAWVVISFVGMTLSNPMDVPSFGWNFFNIIGKIR